MLGRLDNNQSFTEPSHRIALWIITIFTMAENDGATVFFLLLISRDWLIIAPIKMKCCSLAIEIVDKIEKTKNRRNLSYQHSVVRQSLCTHISNLKCFSPKYLFTAFNQQFVVVNVNYVRECLNRSVLRLL